MSLGWTAAHLREAAKEKSVVEREADHRHGQAGHAVQLVQATRREQSLGRVIRVRKVVVEGWRGYRFIVVVEPDVSVRVGSASDSTSPAKMGVVRSLARGVRLGPTAGEEVAVLVCVAAALAADVEVEHLAGFAGRLATVVQLAA